MKKGNRYIALVIAIALVLGIASCSKNDDKKSKSTKSTKETSEVEEDETDDEDDEDEDEDEEDEDLDEDDEDEEDEEDEDDDWDDDDWEEEDDDDDVIPFDSLSDLGGSTISDDSELKEMYDYIESEFDVNSGDTQSISVNDQSFDVPFGNQLIYYTGDDLKAYAEEMDSMGISDVLGYTFSSDDLSNVKELMVLSILTGTDGDYLDMGSESFTVTVFNSDKDAQKAFEEYCKTFEEEAGIKLDSLSSDEYSYKNGEGYFVIGLDGDDYANFMMSLLGDLELDDSASDDSWTDTFMSMFDGYKFCYATYVDGNKIYYVQYMAKGPSECVDQIIDEFDLDIDLDVHSSQDVINAVFDSMDLSF